MQQQLQRSTVQVEPTGMLQRNASPVNLPTTVQIDLRILVATLCFLCEVLFAAQHDSSLIPALSFFAFLCFPVCLLVPRWGNKLSTKLFVGKKFVVRACVHLGCCSPFSQNVGHARVHDKCMHLRVAVTHRFRSSTRTRCSSIKVYICTTLRLPAMLPQQVKHIRVKHEDKVQFEKDKVSRQDDLSLATDLRELHRIGQPN